MDKKDYQYGDFIIIVTTKGAKFDNFSDKCEYLGFN